MITGIYKDKRLWADWPEPDIRYNARNAQEAQSLYDLDKRCFENRPSYEVSPQLQAKWKKGQGYEEGRDFIMHDAVFNVYTFDFPIHGKETFK